MAVTKDQIVAGLKKLGPVSPGELADHLEVEQATLGYHLKKMLDAGELKATGNSKARRIALPDQQLQASDAPPRRASRKAGKKRRGKKAKKARTAPPARAAAPSAPAPRFIPVVDAEKRLHLINGGEAQSFNDTQTEAIATLLLQHYSA